MLRMILTLRCVGVVLAVISIVYGIILISTTHFEWFWMGLVIVLMGFFGVVTSINMELPTILTACKLGRIYHSPQKESIDMNIFNRKTVDLHHLYRVRQVFPQSKGSGDLLRYKTINRPLPEYFMIHPKSREIVSLSLIHVYELQACRRFVDTFLSTGVMDDDFLAIVAEAEKKSEEKTTTPAS